MTARAQRDSLEMLFARPPQGWSSWDAQRTHDYKAAIGDLNRAESLAKIIEAARGGLRRSMASTRARSASTVEGQLALELRAPRPGQAPARWRHRGRSL